MGRTIITLLVAAFWIYIFVLGIRILRAGKDPEKIRKVSGYCPTALAGIIGLLFAIIGGLLLVGTVLYLLGLLGLI